MKQLLVAVLLSFSSLAYCQAIPFEQRGPLVSVTASASYMYGEPQNSTGHNVSLWGWNAAPDINIYKGFAMQGDFGNYYMKSVYPGQNRLVLAAGPRYNFAWRSRVTPFVYAEAGEMRITSQGTPYRDWDPVAIVGVGFKYHMSRHVGITVVPGEYLAHNLDWGAWNENFSSRVGVTYNFFR